MWEEMARTPLRRASHLSFDIDIVTCILPQEVSVFTVPFVVDVEKIGIQARLCRLQE